MSTTGKDETVSQTALVPNLISSKYLSKACHFANYTIVAYLRQILLFSLITMKGQGVRVFLVLPNLLKHLPPLVTLMTFLEVNFLITLPGCGGFLNVTEAV